MQCIYHNPWTQTTILHMWLYQFQLQTVSTNIFKKPGIMGIQEAHPPTPAPPPPRK